MVGIVSRPTHGRALQRMGTHAGEWTRSSCSGLQKRDAVIELSKPEAFKDDKYDHYLT